jgi:hypothetical protein
MDKYRLILRVKKGVSPYDIIGKPLKYRGREVGSVLKAEKMSMDFFDVTIEIEEVVGKMMLKKLIQTRTFSIGYDVELVDNVAVPDLTEFDISTNR